MDPGQTPGPALERDSAAFSTPISHLYRGEMTRMTAWRQRLDVTSNWAILLTFGLTSFALGSPAIPHYTLVLGVVVIAICLLLEARRYRHLYHSKYRLFLMESCYFAELLSPSEPSVGDGWRRILADDLRHTRFCISKLTAVRVRLRQNYLMMLYFLVAGWLVKLFVHPSSPDGLSPFFERLAVGELIPSWVVALAAVGFLATVTAAALTCPQAERLEDWGAAGTARPGRPEPASGRQQPPPPDRAAPA